MDANLLDKVRETVAETLKLPLESVTPESSADTLDSWDSLAQVNLIMSLEQGFDLELDVDEVMELTSVDAIVSYLQENGIA